MFVAAARATAWQSEPNRLVSTPTSASSKNATSWRIIARKTSALKKNKGSLVRESKNVNWMSSTGAQSILYQLSTREILTVGFV